jgi:hypothetical protein
LRHTAPIAASCSRKIDATNPLCRWIIELRLIQWQRRIHRWEYHAQNFWASTRSLFILFWAILR